MSIVNESRPGQCVQIELGGSYCQPSGSEHANWIGQTLNQLNWAGERNAGQPLYCVTDPAANETETRNRMRAMSGEVLEAWERQNDASLKGLGAREEDFDALKMQLLTVSLT